MNFEAEAQFDVELQRTGANQSFGFGLGTADTGDKIVTKVVEGGAAVSKLAKGDLITTINGINAKELSHEEAIGEMISSDTLRLTVERGDDTQCTDEEVSNSKQT